jgi:PrtD family type I secretion system ABC transporter
VSNASPLDRATRAGRGALIALAVFSGIINLLMLTGPLFMLQIYDRVLSSGSVPTLIGLLILVVVLFAFLGIMETIRSRMLVRISGRLDEIMRGPLFGAVMERARKVSPEAAVQPLRDLDVVRSWTAGPGPAIFFDAPWVPVYLAVIFALHSLLGWFALVAATLLFILALLNERLINQSHRKAAEKTEAAQLFADDSRGQAGVAAALGMEGALQSLWETRKADALQQSTQAADRGGTLSSITRALRLLFQSGILALGAWLAIGQEITPGTMIAASIIMSRALAPIEQAIVHWRNALSALRSIRRIKALFAANPPDDEEKTELPSPKGAVTVKGLVCLMPGQNEPILAGVDFKLNPGDGLGIIGPSGAGKSTLVKALLGIWPAVRGEVRIDGATHDQWARDALGRYIGYLPQEVEMLPGTLARNISRFDPKADAKKVIRAAQIAGIHEFAMSFDGGYNTMVGTGGRKLSAGERQRLALARALYGDPPLIVLDEPNSNLDSEGDQALTHAIKAMREVGSTVIVVAHRPSAINAVDQLLYLRDGRQVAFGSKDEIQKQILHAVPTSKPDVQPGQTVAGAGS